MINVLAILLVGGLGYLGWRRGTFRMALPAVAVGAGYVGAFLLYRPVGRVVGGLFNLPPAFALPVGGLIVLIGISALVRIGGRRVMRRAASPAESGASVEEPTVVSRGLGAGLGATYGFLLAALIAWAAVGLRAPGGDVRPIGSTATGRLAAGLIGRVVETTVRWATGDPTVGSVAGFLTSHPSEGPKAVETVINNPRFLALWTDASVRGALLRDAHDFADHPVVRALVADEDFRSAAGQLGLVGPIDVSMDRDLAALELANAVGPLVRAVETLREDAEVQTMIQDPDFQRRYQAGNLQTLVTDPTFNRLAERILAALRGSR